MDDKYVKERIAIELTHNKSRQINDLEGIILKWLVIKKTWGIGEMLDLSNKPKIKILQQRYQEPRRLITDGVNLIATCKSKLKATDYTGWFITSGKLLQVKSYSILRK